MHQPPPPRPDVNNFVLALMQTDAPVPRRLQAATSLCGLLKQPELVAHVQQAFHQLLRALEPTLYDHAEPVRRQGPLLIATLGVALRPNLHPFCSWLLYTAQLASQSRQTQVMPLLLLTINEVLEQLAAATASSCVLPFLPDLLGCTQSMLDGLDEEAIPSALSPLLATLCRPEYVQALLPHLGELVDLLLGWALLESSPPTVATKVGVLLGGLGGAWRHCEPFCLTLSAQLVADMEGLAPEPRGSWQAGLQPGGAPPFSVLRLGRLVPCWLGLMRGVGSAASGFQEAQPLVGRCLAVLLAHAPAPPADADGAGGGGAGGGGAKGGKEAAPEAGASPAHAEAWFATASHCVMALACCSESLPMRVKRVSSAKVISASNILVFEGKCL